MSNAGNVRRITAMIETTDNRTYLVQGGQLTPKLKNSGYLFVSLSYKSKHINQYIHHLVASVFIGDRPPQMDVNHINGIKTDNRATNLEYVSRTENMAHARQMGLHDNRGEKHYGAKLDEEAVKLIRQAHELCGLVGTDIAPALKVSPRTVDDVLRGLTWRHVK